MQFVTLSSGLVAALLATTASAASYNNNATGGNSPSRVKITNNCNYPVYMWSIWKTELGCPEKEAAVVKPGMFYWEQYRLDAVGSTHSVSIKIAKTQDGNCKKGDITQFEYRQETKNEGFNYLYYDMSFVDCENGKCTGRADGYQMNTGGQTAKTALAGKDNKDWCQDFTCTDKASCDKIAYVLPDDVRTKTCTLDAPTDLFLCGAKPAAPEPAPSSSSQEQKKEPSTTQAPVLTEKAQKNDIGAAAITPVAEPPRPTNIKTQVVYVTKYDYVEAQKRHAHGHAHRHFRA